MGEEDVEVQPGKRQRVSGLDADWPSWAQQSEWHRSSRIAGADHSSEKKAEERSQRGTCKMTGILASSGFCTDPDSQCYRAVSKMLRRVDGGSILFIMDALGCRHHLASCSPCTEQADEVCALHKLFSDVKGIPPRLWKMFMCPLREWSGGGTDFPAAKVRETFIDNHTLERRNKEGAEDELSKEIDGWQLMALGEDCDGLRLIDDAAIIWGFGGNPWALLWAFRHSGSIGMSILKRIQQGSCVYIGVSAGAMVMGAEMGHLTSDVKYFNPKLLSGYSPSKNISDYEDMSSGDDFSMVSTDADPTSLTLVPTDFILEKDFGPMLPERVCWRPHWSFTGGAEMRLAQHLALSEQLQAWGRPGLRCINLRDVPARGGHLLNDTVAYFDGREYYLDAVEFSAALPF